jgi:LacI family transcriptional regulator
MAEENNKRVTMTDIAVRAGCSQSTVSRVLAGKQHVDPALRKKILSIAKELDFERDPALQALISYRKSSARHPANWEVIALVSTETSLESFLKIKVNEMYLEGIQEAKKTFGFKTEFFGLNHLDLEASCAKVQKTLHHRGIRGVLLLPAQYKKNKIQLPFNFSSFATVAVGRSIEGEGFNRVGIDYFQNMRTTCLKAFELGYRRFGFCQKDALNTRQNQTALGAFLASTHTLLSPPNRLPELIGPQVNQSVIAEWYAQHRPDVIIASHGFYLNYLQDMGLAVPDKCGFIHYNKISPSTPAGVYTPAQHVGFQSIQLLMQCMQSNQYGLRHNPTQILIPGTFDEGPTIQQQEALC